MSTYNRAGLGIFFLLLLSDTVRNATGYYQGFIVIAMVVAYALLVGESNNNNHAV
jgi:hypothetical protein